MAKWDMSEEGWLTSNDTTLLLNYLKEIKHPRLRDRPLRLFMASCMRRVWHLLSHLDSRRAVEVGEAWGDKPLTVDYLDDVHYWAVTCNAAHTYPAGKNLYTLHHAARGAAMCCEGDALKAVATFCQPPCPPGAADVFRDVMGSPFSQEYLCADNQLLRSGWAQHGFHHPEQYLDPVTWVTQQATNMARVVYQEGTFDPLDMQQIADVLEEAGCEDVGILNHLRGVCSGCGGYGRMVGGSWDPAYCKGCGSTGKRQTRCVKGCAVIDMLMGRL